MAIGQRRRARQGSSDSFGSLSPALFETLEPRLLLSAILDNGLPLGNPWHFGVELGCGCASFDGSFGKSGDDLIFEYSACLDVNGEVFDLWLWGTDAVGGGSSASSWATLPLTSGGTIDVQIDASLPAGSGQLQITYSLTASGGADLTRAKLFQYLDSDLGDAYDDVLTVQGSVAGGDLILATTDPSASSNLAQALGGTMINADASGFAADVYDELQMAIFAGNFDAAPDGTIDTIDLPLGFQPGIGDGYGPNNVTSAIEYSFTDSSTAVVTTTLGLGRALITMPDLQVTEVTGPSMAVLGQSVTVDWTVTNDSLIDTPPDLWVDKVFLSEDDVPGLGDTMLGSFPHDTGLELAGGDSYSMSETLPTPHVAPGMYYLIVVTDYPSLIDEGAMESNNVGVSTTPVLLIDPLPPGTPVSGTLTGTGDTLYYGLMAPAGEYIRLSLDDADDLGVNELSVRYQDPPTKRTYDASVSGVGDQSFIFGETQAGSYIVMVRGADVPDAPADFTLTASIMPFSVCGISPDNAGNAGWITISIDGARFTDDTTVALDNGGGTVIQGDPIPINGMEMLAIFDLTGAPVGAYDVVLSDPAEGDATMDDGFTVTEGGQADVRVNVTEPAYLGEGKSASFLLSVENAGNLNAPLPWLAVSVGGAENAWQLGDMAGSTDFEMLARPEGHLTDALAPGDSVTFTLTIDNVMPDGGLSVAILDETSAAAGEPVDWDGLRATAGDMGVDPAAADAAWADLVAGLGATWGDVLEALRARAVAAGNVLTPIDLLLTDAYEEYLAAHGAVPVAGGSWQWDDLTGFLAPLRGPAISADWNVVQIAPGTVVAGPPGIDGYVLPDDTMNFAVFFEYDPSPRPAAPAREVTITTELDSDLDLSTFELTDISFGRNLIVVPPGSTEFATTVDLSGEGTNLAVDISAGLDVDTSTVTWTFQTLDPVTWEPPSKWWLGFLPPNDDTHAGEGAVGYRIDPADDAPSGAGILSRATADFDGTEVASDPHANTLDGLPPASSVKLKSEASLGVDVLIEWSGQDDPGGIGIASFDIYVSDNGGPFALWPLDDPAATSAVFTGEKGHTYYFHSVATDKLGHTERAPFVPDAGVYIRDLVAHDIVGGKKTGGWSFIDGLGNPVEVNLIGANSSATVYRHVADDLPGDIVAISVLSEYGASATLSIKAAKGATTFIEEDILIQGSLKGLLAGGVILGGDLTATGAMGRIDLGDIDAGHTITIGPRMGDDTKTTVTLNLARVADTSVISETPIKSVTAIEWTDNDAAPDVIDAPWIGKLTTKGAKANAKKGVVGSAGDFQAGLSLSGEGASKAALGSAKIAGDLSEAEWDIMGEMGKLNVRGFARDVTVRTTSWMAGVTVGGADHADFLAGVDAAVARRAGAAADFVNPDAGIKSFKVTGIKVAKGEVPPRFFADSNISAATIGQVNLLNVDFDNGGTGFGVWGANQGTGKEIKSVKWSDKVDKAVKGRWPPKPGEVFDVPDLDVQLL